MQHHPIEAYALARVEEAVRRTPNRHIADAWEPVHGAAGRSRPGALFPEPAVRVPTSTTFGQIFGLIPALDAR